MATKTHSPGQSLIYLHGFNSSPQSEKARLTQCFFAEHSNIKVIVPKLQPEPSLAIKQIIDLVDELGVANIIGFIGSSLGGYYSLFCQDHFLKEGHHIPIALLNPAIRPYELLADYLGENENLYTGERYIVEAHHMDQLKALEVEVDADSGHVYLLTQTGDEVLDYREGIEKLVGAKIYVVGGGDHAFQQYVDALPSILHFFNK